MTDETEKCPDCGCDMMLSCSGLAKWAEHDGTCPTGTDREPHGGLRSWSRYLTMDDEIKELTDKLKRCEDALSIYCGLTVCGEYIGGKARDYFRQEQSDEKAR